jgi:cholesterol transport system auxiliary component
VRLSAGSAGALPLLCLCLAGCSGLFQSKAKPEQTYYLRAPAAPPGGANSPADAGASAAASAAATPTTPVSIRVVRPVAGPGLTTSHIMLVQPDHRMNFFSGSRWTAPTPEVIEALAVETLRASGAWASVEGSSSPFPADYLLHIHVQRFEADYGEGAASPVVHVVLECILGRREGREVLATFTASGTAAAAANRLTEVVSAFEQATGTALEALARQAEQAVREDLKRSAPAAGSPHASSS